MDILCILVTFIDIFKVHGVTFRNFGKDYLVASSLKHLVLLGDRNLRKQFVLGTSIGT